MAKKTDPKNPRKKTYPAERIVRSYSIQRHLFEAAGEFAERVKEETGMSCDRSKLITIFAETLLEIGGAVNLDSVANLDDLRNNINEAVCKRCKKKS